EQGNDLGIERIGLGEPSRGTREIPDLARVDDGKRQSGANQGSGHADLEPAGRLQYDQGRGQGTQTIDELFKACAIARDGKSPARWTHMNIEAILRDIDPDEARS